MKFLSIAFLLSGSAVLSEQAFWSTSRMQGTPEPPKPFIAEQVFPWVSLSNVLDMVPVPQQNAWLFVENTGKIWCVPNDVNTAKSDLAIDIKALHPESDHVYGVTFHPQFATNKQVFITYTNGDKLDDGSRLARFKATQDSPLVIDPKSEEILLTWRSGGHNGAALAFGADGMLYLSTGDSEVPAPPDPLKTGQDLSDLLSSILRIDVDHAADGKLYSVPKDNPFLTMKNARPEIWSYGLRNPWKISFDRATNRLWCGDVGWEQWENVFIIERGGNYGWSATEGNNSIFPERKGPTPITPPVVTHGHDEAASMTGGFVYHGKRLPELDGAYIYGDYETGKIWALWHDGKQVTRHDEIADTSVKIVTFGQAEDGELYFVHWNNQSTVHRLVRNPASGKPSAFPRKLSETGLFTDVVKQAPAAGVHAVGVRAPMWADGAYGERFVGLVEGNGGLKTSLKINKQGKIDAKVVWPKNAVFAKTVSMPMKDGDVASEKKIETQVLHYDGESWNAYSYRWNDEGTDAEIVGPAGDERVLQLTGNRFPVGQHRYAYRFHSRAECLRCHNAWNGFVLGFQPVQLPDKDAQSLLTMGLIDPDYLKKSGDARLVDPHGQDGTAETRARSWLHANCAHCHRENGGGSVPLLLNAELALADMRAVDAKPTRGEFGVADARVISPGHPWQSVLLHRIATSGSGHMPMIGSRELDAKAAENLVHWINELGAQKVLALDTEDPLHRPEAALCLSVWRQKTAAPNAAAAANDHIRGLLDHFLPDDQRVETMGASASLEKISAKQGDVKRGAAMFTATGKAAACLACHFVNGSGRDFGPNLSVVGARLTSPQIVESLLAPSKVIAQGFQPVNVTMNDGSVQTGFVVKRDANELALKIVSGQTVPVKLSDVKSEQALPVSLMPEGLMQSFSAQEAADLVTYLASLK